MLIAPVGTVPKSDDFAPTESFSQHLTKIIRTENGMSAKTLIPVMFVPMVVGTARCENAAMMWRGNFERAALALSAPR